MDEDEENIIKKEKIVWVIREKYGKTVYKDKVLVRRRVFEKNVPPNDYLKYYRVARHWAMKKYDISHSDLELIQYLYSEDIFSKLTFEKYCNIFGWERNRFYRLIKGDMIVMWREKKGKEKAIYTLSPKAKQMMARLYNKLAGEEEFSTDPKQNPLFLRRKARYTDKVMALQIVKINAEIKARKNENPDSYSEYSQE